MPLRRRAADQRRSCTATQVAFSGIFVAAIEIAAPVLLALVITDAAFGVVSRVVPQLNVFAVGFPAKIVVGFVADRRLAAVRRRLARATSSSSPSPPALHALKVGVS